MKCKYSYLFSIVDRTGPRVALAAALQIEEACTELEAVAYPVPTDDQAVEVHDMTVREVAVPDSMVTALAVVLRHTAEEPRR